MSVNPRTLGIAGVLLTAAHVLASCAITRVDADGTIEYWGFARVTLPGPSARPAAIQLSVEGIGLLFMSSPAGAGAAVGYASQSLTVVRDNAMACLSPHGSRPVLVSPVALDSEAIVGGER
jgi:hypothetical protein